MIENKDEDINLEKFIFAFLQHSMPSSSKPISTIYENKWYELALNESFLLLSKYSNIGFSIIVNQAINWNFVVHFSSSDKGVAEIKSEVTDNGLVIIHAIGWEGDSPIENAQPLKFSSKNEQNTILIKLRSSATNLQNNREVLISVWKYKGEVKT